MLILEQHWFQQGSSGWYNGHSSTIMWPELATAASGGAATVPGFVLTSTCGQQARGMSRLVALSNSVCIHYAYVQAREQLRVHKMRTERDAVSVVLCTQLLIYTTLQSKSKRNKTTGGMLILIYTSLPPEYCTTYLFLPGWLLVLYWL